MGAEESVLTVPVSPAETVVLSRSGTLRRSRKVSAIRVQNPVFNVDGAPVRLGHIENSFKELAGCPESSFGYST
ncbi:hypothetical protein HPB50_004710 [Hyalomma asiaticum]|uniref:Uncharacterized protein n=1 Tax=Hyalomma asiaticum TaxID=266040 RepID=A0ACB7ST56_HYAAI|nr:hypothetical protein HPB50_004710 [Hyalomma asiaticum]